MQCLFCACSIQKGHQASAWRPAGTPGGIRTHGLPLRSTENRLIHTVLRCYAMFLKPLKYKAFERIPCFPVSPDFVPFFRLFWRPVSRMLAEPRRETNTNELRFVAELTFLTLWLYPIHVETQYIAACVPLFYGMHAVVSFAQFMLWPKIDECIVEEGKKQNLSNDYSDLYIRFWKRIKNNE